MCREEKIQADLVSSLGVALEGVLLPVPGREVPLKKREGMDLLRRVNHSVEVPQDQKEGLRVTT